MVASIALSSGQLIRYLIPLLLFIVGQLSTKQKEQLRRSIARSRTERATKVTRRKSRRKGKGRKKRVKSGKAKGKGHRSKIQGGGRGKRVSFTTKSGKRVTFTAKR